MDDGSAFGRRYKGYIRISRFAIENFIYVKGCTIENREFQDFMRLYNKPRLLFYLGPLFLSPGKKYKLRFDLIELGDQEKSMNELIGS